MPQLDLKREPASPGRARTFVRELLAEWGVNDTVVEDAELLVTELVTNGVIHARSPVSLEVEKGEHRVSFAISDRGAGNVEMRSPSPDSVTGRGIYLLDQLAPNWEVDKTRKGKTIRFDLSLTPATSVSSYGR